MLNFTMNANFSAYINKTSIVFQSVYVKLNDLTIDVYGCETPEECEEIKKELDAKTVNQIIEFAQSIANAYFKDHPFAAPTVELFDRFVITNPYLKMKEHFIAVGVVPKAK